MELKKLKTKYLGRNIIFFEIIDSTQKKLKSLKNLENGTIVIANNQTNGIGTHDRKWYTGNGQNIAMSFVLFPDCNYEKIKNITMRIAECLVKCLENLYKIKLDIKVPNDIYCKRKKVGGILTESSCYGGKIQKIFIGIGLNVNQEIFPGNLNEIATSLKKDFKKEFDKEEIICEFLNCFEDEYEKMLKVP